MGRRRGGFTLLEVVVVLVVAGVAAGLIVPRMGRSLEQRERREAAGRLAITARTVRELAVARGQAFEIRIDLDRRGYAIVMPAGRAGRVRMAKNSWLESGRWPAAVNKVALQTPDGRTFSTGTHGIRFDPDGTSSGANVYLSGARESDVVAVLIGAHTGRAVVADPDQPVDLDEQVDLGD